MTPTTDAAYDADYELMEIVEFVQMLQRRGVLATRRLLMSSSELDKTFAYAQVKGPCQQHLRVVLEAARRAGWTPPDAGDLGRERQGEPERNAK